VKDIRAILDYIKVVLTCQYLKIINNSYMLWLSYQNQGASNLA